MPDGDVQPRLDAMVADARERSERALRHAQMRTTLVYAIVGVLWIAGSDWVLEWLVRDLRELSRLQTYKGWFFIVATTGLLYVLVDRATRTIQHSQRTLTEQHRALQVLLSNLPGCVYRRSAALDGTIELLNPSCRMFNERSAGVLETGMPQVHEGDRARVEREMQVAVAAGAPYQLVYRVLTSHGERWVWDHGQRVGSEDETPAFVEGYMVDVTETKLLEERLQRGQRLESLGRIAGSIAHDFNNVLTVIMASCEFLSDAVTTREAKEDLDSIRRATTSARELVAQLLAFARQQKRQLADLEIDAVIGDMAPMLKRAAKQRATVTLELGAAGARSHGDRSQLEQILMNLIANAADAVGSNGAIHVVTCARELSGREAQQVEVVDGSYVSVVVRDNGCGIAAHVLPHIFEPFFTTKPDDQGTGLGLATVHGIVHQSRGGIVVRSQVGEGTEIEILLPRCTPAERAVPQGEPLPAQAASHATLSG